METTTEELSRGTQIIYVPLHADGDESHEDAQEGFVTSVVNTMAFCRFWSRQRPNELRTRVNSEAVPVHLLVVRDTRPQSRVDAALAQVEKEQEEFAEWLREMNI